MKIELKKVNNPNGEYWYGIWVDGSCEKSYGVNLDAALAGFESIKEAQKTRKPPIEIIKEETIFIP